MPRDDHVIFVIIVMQWASPLRDIRVHDLTIKSVLNARCLYKSLQEQRDAHLFRFLYTPL